MRPSIPLVGTAPHPQENCYISQVKKTVYLLTRLSGKMDAANYSAYSGYAHLGAGLTVGMSSLAAGLAIGIVGDAGVRANAQQPRLFVGAPDRE